MAAKTTYIATAPDGTEITRGTTRVYTNAVLVEVETRDGTKSWGQLSFNGREELAVKEAAKWQDFISRNVWSKRGGVEERFVRTIVVPVFPKA